MVVTWFSKSEAYKAISNVAECVESNAMVVAIKLSSQALSWLHIYPYNLL